MACRKNSPGKPCCCELKIEDLPNILIDGMTPDGEWVSNGSCCYVRRYSYVDDQPRQVISVDVQRSYIHRVITQVSIYKPYVSYGCGGLFDCAQAVSDVKHEWVERLGLIFQRQFVDVFIQLIKVNCPYTGEADRIVVSTRHAVGFMPAFKYLEFDSIATGTYSALASCCVGTDSLNYDHSDGEPNWSDVSIWPGYLDELTDGEYWSHKIFESMPDGTSEEIDGCYSPCESDGFCVPECESICVTTEPSEIIPNYLGSPVCPALVYVQRTCSFGYNNPFDGTQNCSGTATYYSVTALSTCPNIWRVIFEPSACDSSVARYVNMKDTAHDYESNCSFNYGAEVCLDEPSVLHFPLIAPSP